MAVTKILPIRSTIQRSVNYICDPKKTDISVLIHSEHCVPQMAGQIFHHHLDQCRAGGNTIGRHLIQSFAPGEVDPTTAHEIGKRLAEEVLGGRYAYVLATHVDRGHIHNHIIFNAFNLDCNGKFKDAFFNYRDVARISDKLCKEYELSVIEVKHGWRDPYNEWEKNKGITKADKEPTKREQLENIIAVCLEKQPKNFKQFLKFLEDYSCFSKKRSGNISITAPFSKNPMRLNSLSDPFTEVGIKKQIEEMQNRTAENIENENTKHSKDADTFIITQTVKPKLDALVTKPKELRLIIDIQNSLKVTENIGYKKWAEKFNLEQMSQTLLFIEKHQLSLSELENMATQKPKVLQGIKNEIESVDERLQQISLLQRHIGDYGKTKDVYKQYKQSKNPEQFKQENIKAITDHKAAKAYFDVSGYGFRIGSKLPSMRDLKERYAKHNTEKKSLWAKYHEVRNADKEIDNAWKNVKTLLNLKDDTELEKGLDKKEPNKNAPDL